MNLLITDLIALIVVIACHLKVGISQNVGSCF